MLRRLEPKLVCRLRCIAPWVRRRRNESRQRGNIKRRDAGKGTDAAPPRLVRIRHVDVVRKRLDVTAAGHGEVRR